MAKKKTDDSRASKAAAIRQAQARKDRNRNLLLAAVVLVIVSGLIATAVIFSGSESKKESVAGKATIEAKETSLILGESDATTKVVVYEDFLCPFCREFEVASRDFLREAAEDGKVQVEYRPFVLLQDPYSVDSFNVWAAVMEHGKPSQALKLHDLLFDNQPYEAAPSKPNLDALLDLAKEAGATDSKVTSAANTENQAFMDKAEAQAQADNITGTPTVLVNGKKLEGASIDAMADALQKQINDAG